MLRVRYAVPVGTWLRRYNARTGKATISTQKRRNQNMTPTSEEGSQ
jgi:hypothetical protein